jgi:hypothetical protein
MSKQTKYEIESVEQYLDSPVVKRAIGGGFHYVYGYTRWRVLDTATGQYAPDLYETRDDASAAIRAFITVH